MSDVLTRYLKEFIALADERRNLQDRIAEINQRADRLEDVLIERWAIDGISNMTIGKRIVYLHRQFWARPVTQDWARAGEAIRQAGLGALLRVNMQALSALIREWQDAGEPMPTSFEGVIEFEPTVSLRTRRAS